MYNYCPVPNLYTYDERPNVLEHVTNDVTAGEIKSTYTYDNDNRLLSVNTPLGIQSLSYDGAGRLTRSENSQTGSIRQITYDQRGLPVSSITTIGNDILSTENNVYDLIGNKLRSEENGYVREYRYDGLGRLTSVSEDNKDTIYEFDAYGNISKEHEITGGVLNTELYYYDADNRLILTEKNGNITGYEYDANGNMTREYSHNSDIHYAYDGKGRLTEVIKPGEVICYEYNAEGLRDRKHTGNGVTRFIYDSGSVSAEILPDGNVYKYYRADDIIGSIDTGGNRMYYSQNTHGDVTAIYDATAKILRDYRYSAYGKSQTLKTIGLNTPYLIEWYAETNTIHNPFGYCGEYQDLCSGLIYLRNRYYDPSIGRFISEDPIRSGTNWYVYANNNPVKYVDPWGLEYIVVSGSEEDSRYKYNFIEPAIKKINELKTLDDKEQITWIISKTAYSNNSISTMKDISYEMGVKLITIGSASEFQNYVNSKTVTQNKLSQYRINDPIKKMVFFSHGVRGSVELGYGQSNQSSLSIDSDIVNGMSKDAFSSPNTWFYSCNGATGGINSIAKQWHDVAGGYTGAYIGKTNYQYIMYPENYSSIKKLWSKEMRKIDNSIDSRRAEFGFSKTGSDYYPIPSTGTIQKTWGNLR